MKKTRKSYIIDLKKIAWELIQTFFLQAEAGYGTLIHALKTECRKT